MEERILINAYQGQRSKGELADNQRFESPGTEASSSKGRQCAIMTGCADGKANYADRQSRIAEISGDEIKELAVSHNNVVQSSHEMFDVSAFPTKAFMSESPQQRYSSGLRHPIHGEPDKKSLFQKLRGTPATDRQLPAASPCRTNWPIDHNMENRISSSYWESSKPDNGFRTVLDDGDEVPINNGSSENPILQYGPKDSHESWTSAPSMSHTLSPDDLAPMISWPVTDIASPSSPNSGLAPIPSSTLSTLSPTAKYIYPPSTIVSPDTMTCDDSDSVTGEHYEEAAGDWVAHTLSPFQSMLTEHNNTRSDFTYVESNPLTLRPVYDGMKSKASKPQQTKDSVPPQSIRSLHSRCESKESDAPSVSTQPHHSRTYPFDSEGFIQSNHSDESIQSKVSSSMIQSIVAQIDTSRLANPDSLPTVSSASPPTDTRMQPSSQSEDGSLLSLEPTRSATAFHASFFSETFNHQTSVVTGPTLQEMLIGDNDTWETNVDYTLGTLPNTFDRLNSIIKDTGEIDAAWDIDMGEGLPWKYEENGKLRQEENQDFERSDVGRSLSLADVQLRRSLNNSTSPGISESHCTRPQQGWNDGRPQPAPQDYSRDFAASQELSVKSQPHCFNHEPLLVSDLAPKQTQVEELRNLFHIIHFQWMQKIEPSSKLWLRCSTLSASSLFERAVQTLKDFILGGSAQNFEAIFAVTHWAFAAGWYLHWQQTDYSFNALRDDALHRWQHALSNDEDKVLFQDAMNSAWLPELDPTQSPNSSCQTDFSSAVPKMSHYLGVHETLWDSLRGSKLFKDCIGFLDGKSIRSQLETSSDFANLLIGFEKAEIQERNNWSQTTDAWSQAWDLQHMIKNITQPLQLKSGVEALLGVVIDTERELYRGSLQSPREVEVTLLASGRVGSKSSPISPTPLTNDFLVEL